MVVWGSSGIMVDCIRSDILIKLKGKENVPVRIQTLSGATYEGTIDSMDCLGVLFIPTNKQDFDPAYIFYTDIKKFMLPNKKFTYIPKHNI